MVAAAAVSGRRFRQLEGQLKETRKAVYPPEPREEAVTVVAVGTKCSVSPVARPITAPTA